MAYLPLSTANLPNPGIDPAQDKLPAKYFDTFLYTGNGGGLQVGDVIKKPADTTDITNSLIFNDGDTAYLSRTPSSAGDLKTWTWSGWIKRGILGGSQNIFISGSNVTGNISTQLGFLSDDRFQIYSTLSGYTNDMIVGSSASYKDTSAWYHFVIAVDTTQATASDRAKLYVNGLEVTNLANATYPTQNYDTATNNTVAHTIGRFTNVAVNYFDGYLAEIHFVDGTAHEPTDFGNFDANGIWIPKAVTGITYGTNGFYLDFSDNTSTTTLGEDQAGSNDWTLNNFATTDQVSDSPTDNFATLSPIDSSTTNLSEGNLYVVTSLAGTRTTNGTIFVNSGKFYWEVTPTSGSQQFIGVIDASYAANVGSTAGYSYSTVIGYYSGGQKFIDGVSSTGYGDTYTVNDVIGVALDLDGGTVNFYKNNTPQGELSLTSTGTGKWKATVASGTGTASQAFQLNFGQRAFTYTPPSGFVALSENNITVNETNIESPDFVWIKNRDQGDKHHLYDSVRGIQKALYSNVTTAETDEPDGLLDFNANGFTVGSDVEVNTSGEDYVAWTWKANGAGSANSEGSITTTSTSANTTSGFSIIKWTGDGTIGHGLDEIPEMFIVKDLTAVGSWWVWHKDLSNTSAGYLQLNSTNGESSNTSVWRNSYPATATTIDVNTSYLNYSTDNYLAYCFHSVEGFSKFGSYTGNGSADGTFVYTGFRPAWIMIKQSSASGEHWEISDTERAPYNFDNRNLYANLTNAEGGNNQRYDVLSNGFKLRSTNVGVNSSGATYIYMAFAENPFKYSNAR